MKKNFWGRNRIYFFLGTDPGINYKEIDENADFDDIVLEDREHEERYFDDDDGEIDEWTFCIGIWLTVMESWWIYCYRNF